MERETAIKKYEDLLLGTNPHFYLSGSAADKELSALAIIQYIVLDLLDWTPQEAMDGIPDHVAEQMHLPKLMDYIEYPKDIDDKTDYDYAIYRAFPGEVRYDARKKIVRLYEKIVSGEKGKYPKNYFTESKGGKFRAKCILAHVIDEHIPISQKTPEALFKMFSDTKSINKQLKEWKLHTACKVLFDDSPITFLYETLGEDPKIEFLYNYYTFVKILNIVSAENPAK